jgi:hypothetical protein
MRTCCLLLMALWMLFVPQLQARESGRQIGGHLHKVTGSPTWTRFNVNHLSTLLDAYGFSDNNGANPGLIYPKGGGIGVVFSAGLIWSAQVDSAEDIRFGGTAYGTDLKPGSILDSLRPESPDLPKNRIYRVRPDILPENSTADISSETADGEGAPADIYDQYHKDWIEWPWQDGAPFDDKNGDGVYDPAVDVPGVPGADQTIWFVACDIPGPGTPPYKTPSMGVEMHTTIWGYRSEEALGYMYFRRYLLINRNSIPFNSMYVALWADPDLGWWSDDLVGCDTIRSLGFVYNGQETDQWYSPLPPPAVGFDFFQGPIVHGEPSDSAIFKGHWVHGKRNLPMTAFFANTNSSPDPALDDPLSYSQPIAMYRALQGLIAGSGEPYIDPTNGSPTRFPFNGDPEKRTGWLDGTYGLTYGDRRMGVSTGPFTMTPGDTQEIVVAEICAGAFPGCDRLSAVGLLKFYDDQAQSAYDNFFAVPRAPAAPHVVVSALNNEIVLNWGSDSAAVAATEVPAPLDYAFEGYNIYQLPSASASLANSKRLATFDVVNGVGKIIDLDFDPLQGGVFPTTKEYGTDSGVQRWIDIKTDANNNDHPLVNGSPYYLAVTAYNYNSKPGTIPSTLESSPVVLTVIPHSPDPGTRYGGHSGDSIAPVIHTTIPGLFPSDGTVLPLIMDPSKLTGHQYAVTFDTAAGNVTWNLTDMTTGAVRLSKQENQSGDQHYLAIDGIQTIVTGPPPGMAGWDIPAGTRRFTWAGGEAYQLEGFNGAMGNSRDFYSRVIGLEGFGVPSSRLKNVLLKLAPARADGTFPLGDENVSFAYRYLRGAQNPPAKPEFAPYIANPSGSYAFQDYVQGIPFSAWNVEANPPQRLAVAFLENNVDTGHVDGKWWPDTAFIDNCTPASQREWFWILDAPYTGATPDPAFETNALTDPGLPFMWISLANRRTSADWGSGDEFLIVANHINWPGNSFSFTAPSNVVGDQGLAKNDVSQINVFPNPYYGVNPQELNKYQRFVTFNHLPRKATIRIFNLAGVMVRTIYHDIDSQFQQWDLRNDNDLPVGSGLYIAHIDMPEINATKILKIAIVQEQQILDRY